MIHYISITKQLIPKGISDPGFIGQADGSVPFGLVVVIKHLAHFLFKEVHHFLLWYKSKVICSYSMCGRNELFAAAAGVFVSRNT